MGAWKKASSEAKEDFKEAKEGAVQLLRSLPPMLWCPTWQTAQSLFSWIRAGDSGEEKFGRLMLVCAPGYVLVYLARGRTWLWVSCGVAWVAACWVLADRRAAAQDEEQDEATEAKAADDTHKSETGHENPQDNADTPQNDHETAGEQHQEPAPQHDPEAERKQRINLIWERIEHAVAAAVQAGTRGARTADLLAEFQSGGALSDWTEKQFRDMLRSIEIPVRDQMYFKVDGKKDNKPGVHAEDLANSLGRAPRLPAHLVPDLTPTQPLPPTPSLVKDDPPRQGREGVA